MAPNAEIPTRGRSFTGESRPSASVLVATWLGGGNLSPVLSAASLIRERGHAVQVLASAATRVEAEAAGFATVDYARAPQPNLVTPFEEQATAILKTVAGAAVALDVRDALRTLGADLLIADCMLPAALAAAQATKTATVSVVHFLYGPPRRQMKTSGSGWTTDLRELDRTRQELGLELIDDPLATWEAPELLLVTAPAWLDDQDDYPPNVLHAGPLGVRRSADDPRGTRKHDRPRIALTFSSTPMPGQERLIERVCEAVADAPVEAVLTLGRVELRLRPPDNVQVLEYADHDELFPQCRVVISHGGLGTVLRALAHGVPLVLLPLGRDQGINAERVSSLRLGVRLSPESAPEEIRRALEHVLDSPSYVDGAVRAQARIAAAQPDVLAANALELTIEPCRAKPANAGLPRGPTV